MLFARDIKILFFIKYIFNKLYVYKITTKALSHKTKKIN